MTKPPSEPDSLTQKIGNSGGSGQPQGFEQIPLCGDLDMRIASDGTWFYCGSPIHRKALVKLFSTVLRREDDGQYWLVTPVERGRVRVDDAPFTAVELDVSGTGEAQVLRFRTNLDDWVEADATHPLRVAQGPLAPNLPATEPIAGPANDNPTTAIVDIEEAAIDEPRPYILIRPGLEALILRSVFYELVDLAVEQERPDGLWLAVWSNGILFPLGSAS